MSALRIIVLFSLCHCSSIAQNVHQQLDTLIVHKSYFDARRFYNSHVHALGASDSLYYGAILDNAFNKPNESLEKIGEFYSLKDKSALPEDHIRYLLEIEHADYVRTGQYALAAKSIEKLLHNHSDSLDDEQRKDYVNSGKIWSTLNKVPPQKISKTGDTEFQMQKDKAGLWNLPVTSGETIGFIFDTGANISTVPLSTARRMKMKIFHAGIDVNSITGNIVKADLAVCPRFTLGSISVENAVFLVFPDEALTIDAIDYKIEGILGFPVIEALGEITVSRDGVLKIPDLPAQRESSNMALDFLTPVVEFGGEYFTFDSGATSTILYPKWFKAHEEQVRSESELEENMQYGGAGGVVERSGYFIIWKQEFSGKPIELKNVMVFSSPLTDNEKWFYGNIGQDVIRSFHSYTMNFKSMTISFQ